MLHATSWSNVLLLVKFSISQESDLESFDVDEVNKDSNYEYSDSECDDGRGLDCTELICL